jgi:4'-phosphopantetheinyl transferase EntD
LTGLISRLLVPGMFGAELWDYGQQVVIRPDENVHVLGSGEKRRRDFALGRACARAALAGLGHGDAVIAKGDDGAPIWPAGIVGAITHTKGYAAALVGEACNFPNIGIDAERAGGVTEDLWPRLFTYAEQETLRSHSDPMLAATMFFSAKEASYKAGALKGALAFREIAVSLNGSGFVVTGPDVSLSGRCAAEADMVLAVVWQDR